MQKVLDTLFARRAVRAGGPAPASVEEERAGFVPADVLHPIPADVTVTDVTVGSASAHWLIPPGADPDRVLLFLHGGGFQFGSVRSDGELASRIGRAAGMTVLFLEYRLAPEHPYQAAIDDVIAAWRWLRTERGLDPASMAVAGDSAGGGLARLPVDPPPEAAEATEHAGAFLRRHITGGA
ncbi:alpha/beta hydrolase fold domain-containing protein [Planctomonas sp. JC2975]|nr:alpha/beta hydrolase fold domain-containing protein [Planctomonas sp. JC2975]